MMTFLPEVTIPTYWTWEGGRSHPGDIAYDHPTPLNHEGTLARLLESLRTIRGPEFNVLIITAATNPQLEEAAEAKVKEIIAPFRASFPIAQFARSDLAFLQDRLLKLGFKKELIGLRGYGNVRNIQLIAAQVLGSEIVVGLDDDEIVTDKNYLKKATEFIGKERNGEFVGGVAGFYLDSSGSNKISLESEKVGKGNIFQRKDVIMNAATEAVEKRPGRLVETTFVYGGNMVIHRRIFEEISFDPYITRGEDIDYLINMRLAGYHFFLDKELAVVHLPPPAGSHLREDIIRFIYEKEKLAMAKRQSGLKEVLPESLDPYPGAFLRDGLEEQVREALREHKLPGRMMNDAMHYAQEAIPRYFEFRREWPHLMQALRDDKMLRRRMIRKMGLVKG